MKEAESILEELGKERKSLQEEGRLPEWVTTPGWQLLKSKYLTEEEPDLLTRFKSIAKAAARHVERRVPVPEEVSKANQGRKTWESLFFHTMWDGYLACSTPVLSNMGTDRGCPVSCSGSYIGDSVYDFYENRKECAILSQQGFGTSGYLGDIRPRGTPISHGGVADGVLPVFKGHVQMARDVSQGASRRGSWAGYLPIDHGDFWEVASYVMNNPDDFNLGWNISDDFIGRLEAGDRDAIDRFKRALKVKMVTGKGYFFFVDKANKLSPDMYKDKGLDVKGSNLCTEITLHSDEEHCFTCVLSSLNLSKYYEWKDKHVPFIATVFLDCVAEEFIRKGKEIPGLEKAVRFTQKGRALGLGALGFHTFLQKEKVPFGGLAAHGYNVKIFREMRAGADEASSYLAEYLGEPEWCKGYGRRNTHTLAIAPNLSSALICGSVSQGIEPMYKNVYAQNTPAGEVNRINPVLLELIREKGLDEDKCLKDLLNDNGSVQEVDWLDREEKEIFKDAFEINQLDIIRLAATRQKWIDQAQSINLFFPADEKEEVVSAVHKEAFLNPRIKSLYYIRSEAGVKGSTGECIACHG